MRKFSKQRQVILNILEESYSHPTADEIFCQAREIDNSISLGTVYRNLDLLCQDKIIEKISTPINKDRYDFKKSEHNHGICEKCGKVFDFNSYINLNKIRKELHDQIDMDMQQEEIRIIGICKECKNKN